MKLVVRQKEQETISPHDLENECEGILLIYTNNELKFIYINTSKNYRYIDVSKNAIYCSAYTSFSKVFIDYDNTNTKIYLYNGKFQDIKYKLED